MKKILLQSLLYEFSVYYNTDCSTFKLLQRLGLIYQLSKEYKVTLTLFLFGEIWTLKEIINFIINCENFRLNNIDKFHIEINGLINEIL